MESYLEVNEMFTSIQGEGVHAGVPAFFLRLQGCNLRCPWCDTEKALGKDPTKSREVWSVAQDIVESGMRLVVVTGGEPLLQANALEELIAEVWCDKDVQFHVETNGTQDPGAWWNYSWITVSPKPPNYFITKHIGHIHELKIVIDSQEALEVAFQLSQKYQHVKMSLQPEGNKTEWIEAILEVLPKFVKRDTLGGSTRWRLSLQQHKLLQIR